MSTRVEQFLSHLDRISGGIEPRYIPVETSHPGLPGVTVVVYDDVPEPEMLTGITYGVSLVDHPHWRFGKPELSGAERLGSILAAQSGDPLLYGSRYVPKNAQKGPRGNSVADHQRGQG
ncbi:hypothetical protein [Paenarthrobacter nitroguajacolicus]|uniref:hypothetical protein n=1 Tax=Paenarthrobacter nitroguajacolicus TaxID=211146 RepID=UPI0028675D61|nr:hypothetical protein [Paenarthrobacter nitroguajacolicus]MDR6639051.1 hypothetical protein [Paenarthrobacter nitroguajacolicus]